MILSQYILQDAKLAVIDPHIRAGEESLANSFDSTHFFIPTAFELNQMGATLSQFMLEIDQRLNGKEDRTPLILVIDEFAGLLSSPLRDDCIKTVMKISAESRKVGIYCFCASQQFHKDLIPSVLRNSFTNFISTKSRYDVAHMLSGSKIFAAEIDKIDGFQCVHQSLMGDIDRLNFPNVTGTAVKALLKDKNTVTGVNSSSQSSSQSSSHDAYVVAMLKLGKGTGDIVRECYGVDGKGKAYQNAVIDLRRVISENLK